MFDIGFSEILLVAIAALIAVGPKDLPEMLFRLGRFMRQVKMFTNNLRNQYSDIMHEAELDHYRKELSTEDGVKPTLVIPAEVGIQGIGSVDSRLRGNDDGEIKDE